MAICVFAYLRIWVVQVQKKTQKNYRRHHLKKNVPKCSFAYLRICFQVKEITALFQIEMENVLSNIAKFNAKGISK
jgi:hypothetical protein